MLIRKVVVSVGLVVLGMASACGGVAEQGTPPPGRDANGTPERTPGVNGGNDMTSADSTPPASEDLVWRPPSGPLPEAGPEVVLKFAEGMTVRVLDGALVSLGGHDVAPVRAEFERHPVIGARPLFSRDVEELEAERERARQQAGEPPPDLTLFFVATLAQGAPAQQFIDGLLPLEAIESAYVAPEPAPPPGL